MIKWIQEQLAVLNFESTATIIISYCLLAFSILLVAWIANFIAKRYMVHVLRAMLKKAMRKWADAFLKYKVIGRLAHLAPGIVIYITAPLFLFNGSAAAATFVVYLQKAVQIYMILAITFAISAFLSALNDIYHNYLISRRHPIKTYVQVAKLFLFLASAIYVVSILLDKSPFYLLTGLGAATAIIMLVFKDSILGFVASIQLANNDIVRIGDWVTIPSLGVDGDVIEISLNSVKIRNFDKTISVIPTYSMLTSSIQNWRGMQESGGRRIKRSIIIDMDTIAFCDEALIDELCKIDAMKAFMEQKRREIAEHNTAIGGDLSNPLNGRRLSNVGMFRAYITIFLQNNKKIHKENFTFLVRQLQPTDRGLPIELYIFTNDTNWVNYEEIQADIFDHLLAALPIFKLRAYQTITGKSIEVKILNQVSQASN